MFFYSSFINEGKELSGCSLSAWRSFLRCARGSIVSCGQNDVDVCTFINTCVLVFYTDSVSYQRHICVRAPCDRRDRLSRRRRARENAEGRFVDNYLEDSSDALISCCTNVVGKEIKLRSHNSYGLKYCLLLNFSILLAPTE